MDHNISGPSHSYNVLYSIVSWKQPLGEIIGYIMYCQEQKKVSRKGVAKHISLFIKYLFLWHLSLIKTFNAFLLFCCLIYYVGSKYWNYVKSPCIVWESYIDHYIMIKAVKRFLSYQYNNLQFSFGGTPLIVALRQRIWYIKMGLSLSFFIDKSTQNE